MQTDLLPTTLTYVNNNQHLCLVLTPHYIYQSHSLSDDDACIFIYVDIKTVKRMFISGRLNTLQIARQKCLQVHLHRKHSE